ncbi:MAG: DUF975 family protein [Oscillospiraceae bacterium]|nr:DUF975 family protein [Oscillospiraceae bacterium]
MWSREMLKNNAKEILGRNRWNIALACFIAGTIGGMSTIPSTGTNLFNISFNYGYGIPNKISLLTVIMLPIAIIIAFAFAVFITAPIQVGLCRYMMEARQGKTDLNTLFWAFKKERYGNIVKVMLIKDVYIFLWSLLCFIPGIIKMFEYYYVPYILAENPNIGIDRTLRLSRNMTDGEKADIFILNLSFIGWYLFGMVTCFAGMLLHVTPYVALTNAELYAFVRERSIYSNITNTGELKGFYTAPPQYNASPYQQPPQQQPYPNQYQNNGQYQPYQHPSQYQAPPYQQAQDNIPISTAEQNDEQPPPEINDYSE